MTTATIRHKLPLLVPGQAQKEMFHNESLAAIDVLLHAVVEAVGVDVPPSAPAEGQSWIVGPAPSGAWSGHAHAVTNWGPGGWRFLAAVGGMSVSVGTSGLRAVWDGGRWTVGRVDAERLAVGGVQVVGARQPAIVDPAGGTTTDAEARMVLSAMLAAMRAHGLIG